MGLGGGLLAGGGNDLLAVLRDGRVHDLVILLLFKVVCRYLDISTQYLLTWWHSFLGVSTWRGVQVFTGTEWHTGADTATGAAAYP